MYVPLSMISLDGPELFRSLTKQRGGGGGLTQQKLDFACSRGGIVIRRSLGKLLVNLLQVVKRRLIPH